MAVAENVPCVVLCVSHPTESIFRVPNLWFVEVLAALELHSLESARTRGFHVRKT